MELYTKLVVDVISQDPNQFAADTEKSTNSGGNGEKVKIQTLKSNVWKINTSYIV